MKNFLFAALIIFGCFAQAASNRLQGIDISAAVEFYRKDIQTLEKPITIYNWSPRPNMPDDPENKLARSGATSFWGNYGSKDGAGNMYGYGLYAAADPVLSRSFGGMNGSDWFLIELILPVTFRIIDFGLTSSQARPLTAAVKEILLKFKCPTSDTPNAFFASGGFHIPAECRELTKFIFDEHLSIDGFAYGYGHTSFKDCNSANEYLSSRAFVITKADWMKAGLVFSYNKSTTRLIDRRAMIQTLFYQSGEKNLDTRQALSALISYLTDHPESNLASSKTVCEGEWCTISSTLCDEKKKCETIEVTRLPRPDGPLMSARTAEKIGIGTYSYSQSGGGMNWLWDDLEGKPKEKTVSAWLKANKFGCDVLPYKAK